MITHRCRSCTGPVEVARIDVSTMVGGPQFMWGRHEECRDCGSRERPTEVIDANDGQLGLGQWEGDHG